VDLLAGLHQFLDVVWVEETGDGRSHFAYDHETACVRVSRVFYIKSKDLDSRRSVSVGRRATTRTSRMV
jgi:hypothetical protein